MVYNFDYTDVLSQCVMLSSYEGRDFVGKSGESLFLDIKITAQDKPLINTYIVQAAQILQEKMGRMITSADYIENGFTWNIRTEETRWNVNTKLDENLKEALVSYAMMNWLLEKKADKAPMYKSLWDDMSAMCVQNVFRKMPPRKKRERKEDICEVEINAI